MDTRCNYLWSYMFILTSATINTTSFTNILIFRFCYPNDSINVVYKKYGMKYWQIIRGWSLETVRKFPPTKCWRQNIQYVTLNVKMTTASPQIIGVLRTHSKHSSINRWAFRMPFQHNDKKTSNTTIFGMHTHNTRLRINTNMV